MQAKKAYSGDGGRAPIILNLGTRLRWLALRSGRFTPRKSGTGTHWLGGQVDSRAGLGFLKWGKSLYPTGIRTPDRPPNHYTEYTILGPVWMKAAQEWQYARNN